MIQNNSVTIQCWLVSIVLALFSYTSTAATQQKEPPLYWPGNHLIPVSLVHTTVTADGLEFQITKLNNSELPLYGYSLDQWVPVSRLKYRKASLALSNRKNPSIMVGLSIVNSENWLKSLQPETLQRYIAGMSIQHAGRFTLLEPDRNFAPIPGTGYFIGHPYKLVHYEIDPEEEGEPALVVWDFITEINGTVFVLSFECPKPLASRNSATPLTLLNSIDRADELG